VLARIHSRHLSGKQLWQKMCRVPFWLCQHRTSAILSLSPQPVQSLTSSDHFQVGVSDPLATFERNVRRLRDTAFRAFNNFRIVAVGSRDLLGDVRVYLVRNLGRNQFIHSIFWQANIG
jgi:hypothetical protein